MKLIRQDNKIIIKQTSKRLIPYRWIVLAVGIGGYLYSLTVSMPHTERIKLNQCIFFTSLMVISVLSLSAGTSIIIDPASMRLTFKGKLLGLVSLGSTSIGLSEIMKVCLISVSGSNYLTFFIGNNDTIIELMDYDKESAAREVFESLKAVLPNAKFVENC